MAESPEHQFLSEEFLKVLNRYSSLQLYGYTEADRKRYDFACVLERDWTRPLVGQTLWKHSEGIDKDIRIMISVKNADIWAYIARDTARNRSLLHEVVEDFKRNGLGEALYRLKVFWVPGDFDADNEYSQQVMQNILEDTVVNDILFNVVFGKLSAHDIRYFLNDTGIPGLSFAVLYSVAIHGFVNYRDLQDKLSVSSGPLRERIMRLTGSGFIWQFGPGSMYYVSLKGRVFLELVYRLFEVFRTGRFTPELTFITDKLGLKPLDNISENEVGFYQWDPARTYSKLIHVVSQACKNWSCILGNTDYKVHHMEHDHYVRIYR